MPPQPDNAFTEPCYYCGDTASSIDHVIPRKLLSVIAASEDESMKREMYDRHRVKVVPSCKDCNVVLGSQYFDTLEERKAYVLRRLRQRRKNVLRTPDWSQEELSEIGDGLRQFVEHSINQRDFTRKRLAWKSRAPRISRDSW